MSNNQSSSTAAVSAKEDAASIRSTSTIGSTTKLLKDQKDTSKSNSSSSETKSQKDTADRKKVTDSASLMRSQININF